MDHYSVNKFLYDTDRNPTFLQRYIDDPVAYVDWYLTERAGRLPGNDVERSGIGAVDLPTREALAAYDIAYLYARGAHPFILWTLMLPVIQAKLATGEFEPPPATGDARPENAGPMAYYRSRILALGRPDFRY